MIPQRPVWLAEDASAALAVRQPLGRIGRPGVRGREHGRRVMFAVVPAACSEHVTYDLAAALTHEAGPTRAGQVVVSAAFTHEEVARSLSGPVMQRIPAVALNEALAAYDAEVAAHGAAALLVASCPVLWQQTRATAALS